MNFSQPPPNIVVSHRPQGPQFTQRPRFTGPNYGSRPPHKGSGGPRGQYIGPRSGPRHHFPSAVRSHPPQPRVPAYTAVTPGSFVPASQPLQWSPYTPMAQQPGVPQTQVPSQQFLVQPHIPTQNLGQPSSQLVHMVQNQQHGLPAAVFQNGQAIHPHNYTGVQPVSQVTISQNGQLVQFQGGAPVITSDSHGQMVVQNSQMLHHLSGQLFHPQHGSILQSQSGQILQPLNAPPGLLLHPLPQPPLQPQTSPHPALQQIMERSLVVHPSSSVHPQTNSNLLPGPPLPQGYQVMEQQTWTPPRAPSVPPTPPYTSQRPPSFPPPNFSQPPPNYLSPPSLRLAPSPRYETPPKTPGICPSPQPYVSPPPTNGGSSDIPDLRHQFLSTQLLPHSGQLVVLPPLADDRSVQTIQLLTPTNEGSFHVQTIILPILKVQEPPTPPPPPLPYVPATSPRVTKDQQGDQEILLNQVDSAGLPTIMQGVDLEQVKQFASEFKSARLQLGLTQTQVGQALTGTSEDQAVSQSTICRFEKLEITAMQVKKLLPQLRSWLAEARRRDSAGLPVLSPASEVSDLSVQAKENKKRKKRTMFNPETVNMLTLEFNANPNPPAPDIEEIAERLDLDKETVKVWFCNKRSQNRKSQT